MSPRRRQELPPQAGRPGWVRLPLPSSSILRDPAERADGNLSEADPTKPCPDGQLPPEVGRLTRRNQEGVSLRFPGEHPLLAGLPRNEQARGSNPLCGFILTPQGIPGVALDGTSINTIANLWPTIGKLLAGVGNNRLAPVEALLLAPRRWAWIASSGDSSNRPLASPGQRRGAFLLRSALLPVNAQHRLRSHRCRACGTSGPRTVDRPVRGPAAVSVSDAQVDSGW
jgi:hypothetical protein